MEKTKQLIIAIDGYSSCGKSTFAKAIAQKLGYIYIDTGAMYRAVTLWAFNNGFISNNEIKKDDLILKLTEVDVAFNKNPLTGENEICLGGAFVEQEIRLLHIAQQVSSISAIKEVRTLMVALQRKMGGKGGVVLDGRDIGTVVFPNAQIKIFMTADPVIRAQRRYDELTAKGTTVSFNEILDNVKQRDLQDTTRAESPLTQATDAIILDNGHMTPEQQMDWFVKLYHSIN